MPTTVLSIVLILAFLSGPAAFVLLWITYRKTEEAQLRSLAYSMLGLCLILLGNTATWILDEFVRPRDPRLGYLIMNEVFLASVMTGVFLGLFAHQCTGAKLSLIRKTFFWAFTIVFFFLVQSLPLFLSGPGVVNVDDGYLPSTIYGVLCQAYATILIVSRRPRIPPPYRGFLPPLFAVLLFLGLLSVLNDLLHFGVLLHGSNFPFSPFFFILTNIAITVFCARELLRAKDESKGPAEGLGLGIGLALDAGLSEREKDLLPLIAEGLSNEEIAARLFISPHTVKNHVTSIFRKTGVASRFELLRRMTLPPS